MMRTPVAHFELLFFIVEPGTFGLGWFFFQTGVLYKRRSTIRLTGPDGAISWQAGCVPGAMLGVPVWALMGSEVPSSLFTPQMVGGCAYGLFALVKNAASGSSGPEMGTV